MKDILISAKDLKKEFRTGEASQTTLAFQISAYYSQQYQIIFSVHEDTDHWHIHFVMNTVSFVDGKMFSEGPYELAQFKDYVDALIRIYENRFNRQMLGYD